jgi:hypothetical protein
MKTTTSITRPLIADLDVEKKNIKITVELLDLDKIGDLAREHNMTITDAINMFIKTADDALIENMKNQLNIL